MVLLTELSLGSSSSSSSSTHNHNRNHIYDVFLSFRGADTRNNFTDHLYNALLDAGITAFLDDKEIETGEPLKPELISAIKSSRISIIILSKNYASSTWCLDELVLILEQHKNFNQIVIPIFYDVEPTVVRKQQRTFGEAMANHKKAIKVEKNADKRRELAQKMELWKMALTQVAGLKGKCAKDRKEADFIKEVVTDIHGRLGVPLSNTLPLIIGIDFEIKSVSSWLTDGSCHTADILTVAGMGGIGKTYLARYAFSLHSSEFQKSSFIEGIDTRCKESFNGLLDLQQQLHGNISQKISLQVNDVYLYTSKIENALARKRALIVLDDIGSLDQLDALLGKKDLHPGSKIIITTKDASLTERCALFNPQVQPKHRKVLLRGLCNSDSLKLLCIHAFKSQKPKEGYKDVSQKLVKYCEGHPLALQVLGRSLHNRDVAYWEDCIEVLKKEPHSHINNALKMSIESLPSENDKELFKHIACFFVRVDRDVTETILNACDINTRSGITNLMDRCLLSIGWKNQLMMHQLIQDMGRDLVRQESPNKPWKRSRLWCHEESFKVLKQNKGTENILGLALDVRMFEKEESSGSLQLKTEALSKMDQLKLLQLNYVKINGSYKNISQELRWLCMHGSHFKLMPSELPMKNLVALDMSYSNIESFDMSYSSSQPSMRKLKGMIRSRSKDKRLLGSLKILDLSFCEKLLTVGGFFELPVLERLIVRKCISLVKVCESVEQCIELVHIDLSNCCKLKRLPKSLGKLKKVQTLQLDGCSSHESISDFKLFECSLPSSLRVLSLANSNLCNESFPMDFSSLAWLEDLCLDGNPIVSMPNCVRSLPRLQRLSMNKCDKVISIEHPPSTLRELQLYDYDPDIKKSLRKIKFHHEMSPLTIDGLFKVSPHSSIEIDGVIKIQAMKDVDEKIVHSLGWADLEFIREMILTTYTYRQGRTTCQTKMYYEFGIFSTIYKGEEMPNWITYRTHSASSFIIPLSPKKLRGFNLCCVIGRLKTQYDFVCRLPIIKISNITKNRTWIYKHYVQRVENMVRDSLEIGGACVCLLIHWMCGPNEMKGGDHITITQSDEQLTREFGFGLVYDEDGKVEEEDDPLGYYKSWNHIIGGDLSPFQLTTGQYFLNFKAYLWRIVTPRDINPFSDDETRYKEMDFFFKAFSPKKCGCPSHACDHHRG